MTTQLKAAPVTDGTSELHDAALAWADNSAALAQALAAGLRSGGSAVDVAEAALPLLRATREMCDLLCELIEPGGRPALPPAR
jgi:hypothetical protein